MLLLSVAQDHSTNGLHFRAFPHPIRRAGDGVSMSKHRDPTWLGVVDRALDDQLRTARLQALIITVTCCGLLIAAPLAAVLAAGGHTLLSMGLGSIPVLMWAGTKARKLLRKSRRS